MKTTCSTACHLPAFLRFLALNGLFTYALLEALDGRSGVDSNKDGLLQLSEITEYAKGRVAEFARRFGVVQTPNVRRVNLEADFSL